MWLGRRFTGDGRSPLVTGMSETGALRASLSCGVQVPLVADFGDLERMPVQVDRVFVPAIVLTIARYRKLPCAFCRR